MTTQPPSPPPPDPAALARLQAENAALTAQLQNQALREAAGAFGRGRPGPGRGGNVSVIKDGDGHVVVTGADGRVVRIDPKVGLDEDAVQSLVQSALAPPRFPGPPRGGPPEDVMIVAIVFSFLLLMTLVISVARLIGRRVAAKAATQGVAPELGARLARIEQAIEAVAIEVERISESERYSARLLTERLPGAQAAQGVAAPVTRTADVVR